jgi:tetratricopeptide (TPR) repeat protein
MNASVLVLAAHLAAAPAAAATTLDAASSPRDLYQAGRYQDTVDRVAALRAAGAAGPGDIWLMGQSLAKLNRDAEARDAFASLGGDEDDAWTFIGRSAAAVLDGNLDAALEHARAAVERAPDAFHPNMQLGIVQTLRNDVAGASAALEKAVQIDGADAYAHYYAGLAASKLRRTDRMIAHFEAFIRLAPEAPERPTVETLLRTVKR